MPVKFDYARPQPWYARKVVTVGVTRNHLIIAALTLVVGAAFVSVVNHMGDRLFGCPTAHCAAKAR